MSEVSLHRWAPGALAGDLARGAIAVVVVLLLLAATAENSIAGIVVSSVLLVLLVLFGLYVAGTVSRWISVVEVDDKGLRLKGGVFGQRTIEWAQLKSFELRHFPLSRDRKTGWMDLKLKTATSTISLDDRLDRFGEVLARAWQAAQKAEVGISDVTHANLVAAGLLPKTRL